MKSKQIMDSLGNTSFPIARPPVCLPNCTHAESNVWCAQWCNSEPLKYVKDIPPEKATQHKVNVKAMQHQQQTYDYMPNNNDGCSQVDQNGVTFWTGPDGQKNYANNDQLCAFYMRGKCAYGDSCNKSHDQNRINQAMQKKQDKLGWYGKSDRSKNGKGSGKGNWNSKGGKGKGEGLSLGIW